ncbi:MAG: TAT-variant-translocated molybdopterin oxidoreductase [Roseivirga sp.]|nr:TAT-variant-translocated molybdopterin oxidoreductase [Roseivirga sp.]
MKENQKTYWKGIEQLKNDPSFVKHAEGEFPEYLPINENEGEGSNRRDFLKMMGFGIAAASLAACEAPIRKAIPYLNKPVDVDPSIPNYYASTYINGGDGVSVVVKTREGRPIKVEGNKYSPISHGGTNAQVEASVLSLYDKERLKSPMKAGQPMEWLAMDNEIRSKLAGSSQIRIVSNSVLSPTTKKAVGEFVTKFPSTQHISYDPVSAYGLTEANRQSFGEAMIPSYDFSKAKTIVSVGADFLGTWLSPIEFTKQYSKTRKINSKHREMSRHYQFETNLSLTGSNADYRTPIKPSQVGPVVAAMYNAIAAQKGQAGVNAPSAGNIDNMQQATRELLSAQAGTTLVVSGSNDPAVQVLVNGINSMLGNYGTTINTANPMHARQGNDQAMASFVRELNAGSVDAVIFLNCNPVYDSAEGKSLEAALSKAKLKISTSDRNDETTSLVDYIAPDHHYLEQWNDAELKQGHFSLVQPTIAPLFDTRQAPESFLAWSGNVVEYYKYLQDNWRENFFTQQSDTSSFQMFWDKTLFDGVFQTTGNTSSYTFNAAAAASAGTSIAQNYKSGGDIELALYEKIMIGNGSQANNPWLQEASDPISKATWDNYLTISQEMATAMDIDMVEENTQSVTLTVETNGNTETMTVPVLVQPGQAPGTVGLALGYGRTKAGRVGNEVGVNAYPLITKLNGANVYDVFAGVTVTATGDSYKIARTQTHQTYMNRSNVIQESVLGEYKKDTKAGRVYPKIYKEGKFLKPSKVTLWKGHEYKNHHWGMTIDMNSCTGCSACTVACQAENNIPVVGKEEVLNRREMAWIRIDRYYSSDADVSDKKALEKAAANPEVTFQPMMCQHCNNAPCETVCPVAATTHSTEGLNQMTYNRCIGTRYCANNCPYKVRRFNWFKYHDNTQFDKNLAMNNDLGKMVLNPDVTVRARGVMEKCTMCVQRIQAGKLTAKKEGRRPVDGDITTACASACPADAITFGDLNDINSQISKSLHIEEKEDGQGATERVIHEDRAYHVLEEINVNPNIWYMTKIRNKDKSSTEA